MSLPRDNALSTIQFVWIFTLMMYSTNKFQCDLWVIMEVLPTFCSTGLPLLLSPGGLIDRTMNMGRVGASEIIKRTLTTWRLNVEGTLPADTCGAPLFVRRNRYSRTYKNPKQRTWEPENSRIGRKSWDCAHPTTKQIKQYEQHTITRRTSSWYIC